MKNKFLLKCHMNHNFILHMKTEREASNLHQIFTMY